MSPTQPKPRQTGRDQTSVKAPDRGDLPRWLPVALYALVTVVLFREVVFSGSLLLGQDTFALSYFARQFYTTFVQTMGRIPLWNPLLFGGLPFVDGMHGDIFYPPSLALFFLDAQTMWGWKMLLHVFAAGILTYVWLRGLELSRGAAFFGGLVFMMGADLVSLVVPGGDGKLFVSALAPLMFWLTERCARNRRVSDFALFALGLALVVFTSHMQLAYFTVWGVSLYFVFRVWQVWRAERNRAGAGRLVGLFAIAGVLGVGAAAVQFLPPLEYLREWSHRADKTVQAAAESGYAYSTSYALNLEEAASLVIPDFVGDNVPTEVRSPNRYWGRNFFKINNEYAGLIPLLLLPLLLVSRRTARTWFFAGLAGISVLYGLGSTTPVFRLFYLVPGVSLFRAPSLIIFLYGLSVATLGAFALQRLIDDAAHAARGKAADDRKEGRTRAVLWGVAGVFLLLALAQSADIVTNVWQSVFGITPGKESALAENLPYIRTGFWIAFGFAAMVAGLWETVARGILGAREAVIALAVLAALDLYRVDRPYIHSTALGAEARANADPTIFTPDETIRFLQERQAAGEIFRVYDLGNLGLGNGPAYESNVMAIHGIEQLTGHHGNEIGRYRDLMGGSDSAPNVGESRLRLLDIANVEYVVSPQRIEFPGYEEVHLGSRAAVYRNQNVLPRAFVAGTVEVVVDERAVERLLAEDFDGANTVLLPEVLPPGITVEAGATGTVSWRDREVDGYTLEVQADRAGLLVISENYYPAWKARVDGEAVTVLRANYAFRAIPVPAGTHEVELFYDSTPLNQSAMASVAILVLLGALASTGLFSSRSMKRKA